MRDDDSAVPAIRTPPAVEWTHSAAAATCRVPRKQGRLRGVKRADSGILRGSEKTTNGGGGGTPEALLGGRLKKPHD